MKTREKLVDLFSGVFPPKESRDIVDTIEALFLGTPDAVREIAYLKSNLDGSVKEEARLAEMLRREEDSRAWHQTKNEGLCLERDQAQSLFEKAETERLHWKREYDQARISENEMFKNVRRLHGAAKPFADAYLDIRDEMTPPVIPDEQWADLAKQCNDLTDRMDR